MISRNFLRNMSRDIVNKLKNNVDIAENRLAKLKSKLQEIREAKIEEELQKLACENAALADKVENVKAELIRLEVQHGKKQYSIPGKAAACDGAGELTPGPTPPQAPAKAAQSPLGKPAPKKEPKAVKEKDVELPEISRLDLRVGKILDIKKHPDADSLYVELIDCGDDKPRTVVSGLVKHVPIEEMQDRMVMLLCNLKPVKMRGVTSEGMVMCASTPDKVEVLVPPLQAIPGDLVSCLGFPREPDAIMNPKKKIFETVAPDLKTNEEKIACYKNKHLVVLGKGPIVAPTLKGVYVK